MFGYLFKCFWSISLIFGLLHVYFPMLGWVPVDIGPVTLDEIKSLLTKCKVN